MCLKTGEKAMELRQTVESLKEFAVDMFLAGKVAVGEFMAGQDTKAADILNSEDD